MATLVPRVFVPLERRPELRDCKMAEMAADLSVNKIILLQALVRGFLVRRKLQEVRKEFEEVFNELETAELSFVCWKKEALGLPLIDRDPKALNGVKEQTKSGRRENEGDIKQGSDSVEEEFDVKRSEKCETVLNTEDGERVDGEKNSFDEELELESAASGASNSESHTNRSALQINRAFCLENNRASMHLLQEHRPRVETILPEEQSSEKQRFLILNSEVTNQRGFPDDERYSDRVLDSPLPLNSTLKPESGNKQERRASVTHDSTSETSLQSYLQGGPHLREQARLSDTWLTDRSFDAVVDEEPIKSLPADPVKLQQLRDHIGMELLWTEQAIQSRKKYLSLRKGLAKTDKYDQTINWE